MLYARVEQNAQLISNSIEKSNFLVKKKDKKRKTLIIIDYSTTPFWVSCICVLVYSQQISQIASQVHR